MKNKNESCSMSYVKNTGKENLAIYKDCKHKWKIVFRNRKICVRCGFEKW